MRRIALTFALSLLPLSIVGCASFKLDPPAGFAEAERYDDGVHMKANNDVGLRVSVFHNTEGGTLPFWSRDLVEKLGERGYQLTAQTPAESKNGVVGTRFDFSYTPVGKEQGPRFYTAVLFVTDENRVVLDLAGREEHRARYSAEVDAIAAELKVRGCKLISKYKTCKGPQPEKLSTPAPAPAEGSGDAKAETKAQ